MAKFTARIIGPRPGGFAIRGRGKASTKRVAAQRAVESMFDNFDIRNDGADTTLSGLTLHVMNATFDDVAAVDARLLKRAEEDAR